MRLLIALCAAALFGCASGPQLPERILVPVASSCVPPGTPPVPTISTNAELRDLDDLELVLRIAAERLELAVYALQAAPIIEACR